MKNQLIMYIALLLSVTIYSPSYALFSNGGFETGNTEGWTITTGWRDGSNSTIYWSQPNPWGFDAVTSVIGGSGDQQEGSLINVKPYNGNFMIRINDSTWGQHTTKIYQTDTINQKDIDDGAKLYVNWGAMLADPSDHPTVAQPYFKISITLGGITSMFDAFGDQTTGWIDAGENYGVPLKYKTGTFVFDLAQFELGTPVTIEMIASDCSWSGHGGWAYLDGIGTTYQAIGASTVPEPSTLLLLGIGFVGLGFIGKKINKVSFRN